MNLETAASCLPLLPYEVFNSRFAIQPSQCEWLLPCSQDVVGPDVPEQDDFLLPLEGNSVAFGHAHLPDIPCALYLLHPERRMAGVVLV